MPNLRSDQREVAVSQARFKVVACGRRWGKTTLGVMMAVRHALRGHRVWWVAPTYLLADDPWRAFKGRLASQWAEKTEYNRTIHLKNGGMLSVKTADYSFGLRGVGLDFVVIDEAAFMSDEAWRAAIRPALSDNMGDALFLSTPKGRNWFHEVYLRGQDDLNPDWQSWTYPTSANPSIPLADIDQARRDMPELVFQQEYEAKFLEGGGVIFRDIYSLVADPPADAPVAGGRYVMGIDFGRYQDFTVCVVIDADLKQVVAIDRFNLIGWQIQRERILALARKWGVWYTVAEANAMGEPNIEALRREGLRIKPFQTTAFTKVQLIENLVSAFENREIRLMPHPTLLDELATFTYRHSPTGHTFYEASPGYHDDCVIALALAWQEASRPRIALAVAAV